MIQIIGNRLSQWDVGRLVGVTGEASHVHFANQGDSKAVIIDIEEGEAKIPDYLLQTGKTLLAYAVKDGVTLESYTFAVRNRERPENYVYEEDWRNYIYELIRDAESAIARAGQTADEADIAADEAREACYEAKEAAKNANAAADNANKAATNAVHQATVEYMNIRVDLNTSITDGTEVVFRSPVDCSQVTGLIVYYQDGGNTLSKEFAFADAHGNNVGDIDNLFAKNVVVKVILDVTAGMAFVQNADTNAYLEGRFAEAVTHTPQVLPDKKKAQARENIDAAHIDDSKVAEDETWSSQKISDTINGKTLLVTYDEQGERTSHNAADIYDHVATGGTVVLLYQNDYFTLARATESYAEFSYCGETDDAVYNICITSDGTLLYGKELVTGETLEAAQKGIIDKLCPAFSESGSVVTCQPVEGYPLSVVSQIQPVQEGEGDPRPNGPNLIADMTYQNESEWHLDDVTQFYIFDVGYSFNNGQYRFSGSTGYEVMLVVNNPELADWQVAKAFSGTFDEVVELTYLDENNNGMIGLAFTPEVIESRSLADVIDTLDGLRLEKGTGGNIRPITGHSTLKLTHRGRNLFNDVEFYKANNFEKQPDGTWSGMNVYKTIYENTSGYTGQITITATGKRANPKINSLSFLVQYTDGTNEYLTPFTSNTTITTSVLTTRADKVVGSIVWAYANSGTYIIKDVQLEYGAVAHDYDAYKESVSIVADLGRTVYGGTYNWATGALELTKTVITLDSSCSISEYGENIAKNCSIFSIPVENKAVGFGTSVCSHFRNTKDAAPFTPAKAEAGIYTDHSTSSTIYLDWGSDGATAKDFSAWLDAQKEAGTPVQLLYLLAEPIIEPIEAHAVLGLQGVNVLSVDTGFLSVAGRADPGAIITSQQNTISRILERVAALEAAVVNNA